MKSIGVGILPIHGTACLSGHSLIEPNFHPLHKTMYYNNLSLAVKIIWYYPVIVLTNNQLKKIIHVHTQIKTCAKYSLKSTHRLYSHVKYKVSK